MTVAKHYVKTVNVNGKDLTMRYAVLKNDVVLYSNQTMTPDKWYNGAECLIDKSWVEMTCEYVGTHPEPKV